MKNKFLILILLVLFFRNEFHAQQNVLITDGNATTPAASSLLELNSTNKGILIPRVALTSTTNQSPVPVGTTVATALLIYNTATINDVTPGFYYWENSKWNRFDTGNNIGDWKINGNTSLTSPAAPTTYGTSTIGTTENWIGTTDAVDFVVGTNQIERFRILKSTGKVGIGTAAPAMRLDVTDASTTANDATIRGAATGNAATFGMLGTSTSAVGQGVFGFNSNASGTGVIGAGNNLAAQYLIGGSGGAFSSTNVGVFGYGNNTAGSYGVWGQSINATGAGVVGQATSSSGANLGVYATTSSPAGDGLFAFNSAASGTGDGNGVYGTTAQSTGYGIWGTNSNSSGTGVTGSGNGVTSSYLIAGSGGAFSGSTIGAYCFGSNTSSTGILGVGNNLSGTTLTSGSGVAGTGTRVGIYGRANDETTAGTTYTSINTSYNGVLGYSTGNVTVNTNLYHFGVHGRYSDLSATGIYANRSGGILGSNNYGSWSSLGYLTSGNISYGQYYTSTTTAGGGYLPNSVTTGIGSGGVGGVIGSWTRGEVMGHLSSGELFASYNLGDEYTSGHQIELVETENEKTPAFSVTSTEIKIYADGKSELKNGLATVKFSENFIKLLGDYPNVTVTPIGESEGLHLQEITKTGFTVKENKNGTSSIQFTWIAVGNRIDDKSKSLIPSDLTDRNFDRNMKDVMFNESDTKHSAKPIWWDGTKIRFDEIKQKSKSTQKTDIEIIQENKSHSKSYPFNQHLLDEKLKSVRQ